MKFESIRQRKLADQIKNYLSQIIDRKIKDPAKGYITITHVKISGDLRIASAYFTTLGDTEQRKKSEEVLQKAKNFIRKEMGQHLKLRFIPELRFFYDNTLEYSRHIDQLLEKIKSKDPDSNAD